MPSLPQIREALARHVPERLRERDARHAAVALCLREAAAGRPEVLLIERARREGDPWSGHMAFPGGIVEAYDASARSAAVRETKEEVGLDLLRGEALGRLDDLHGRHAGRRVGLVVSAFVFHVPDPEPLCPNHEVETALWFPLADLHAPERRIDHRYPAAGDVPYPGILVGEPGRHVVWGLTYRFLELFFQVLARPLPDRWEALRARDSGAGR